MVGSKTVLVGYLKQLRVKCAFLHCIIHQEVLCGKIIKMNQTMKMVVNIVRLIRGGKKAQRHRAFIALLDEKDADYGEIPLHSDIRWLSTGKYLQHSFFVLRKEILLFLQTENLGQEFQRELQDMGFIHSHLSCRFNVSFKCPEFEFARQEAEYISSSRSH
jgi:hypothetical protein